MKTTGQQLCNTSKYFSLVSIAVGLLPLLSQANSVTARSSLDGFNFHIISAVNKTDTDKLDVTFKLYFVEEAQLRYSN